MLRSLIKLGLFLVAGILVYNYFFGTPEEKAQSKEIFTNVRDLTRSAFDLLKAEKQKFDEGKYDEAVDKIGGLIDDLKGKAAQLEDNKELLDQIADLEQSQRRLTEQLRGEPAPEGYDEPQPARQLDSADKKQLEEDWETLVRKTERLMDDMERKAQ
ncbi:hypothetical protein [Phaeodactylibacter luteus]|uniref:Uncharacterized protein n=1 Tax=Phaeodactylibacter luteus TaxID=1564516 RepID=A0A5C6RN54_9BACT|nr:hypothetical protein [Phaeodactylibacter luteus]TXB62812.1 hypothetical protein FRY97_12100 [Phaeodactylibacter luteus]